MELVDFLTKLKIEATYLSCKSKKEVALTISKKRVEEMIEHYTTHTTGKFIGVKSCKLFGFDVYPSEFISDDNFVVGFKN